MGEPGSLGKYSRDAQDSESRFSVSISKALAGCLRHGHHPPVTATSAGWVLLEDLLSWPRISRQHTTPGDLLEIARHNSKSRYEIGYRPSDRTYYMRAVQGHSRSDVHDDDLLERCTEETLPGVLLHGTKLNGIFMKPSAIKAFCLKLCSLRSKVAAGKARRDLRDVDTYTSSLRKIEERKCCQASVRMPLW